MSSRIEQQRQDQARQAEKAQKAQDRSSRDQQKTQNKRQNFSDKIKKQGGQEQNVKKHQQQRTGQQKQASESQNTSQSQAGRGNSMHQQRMMQQAKSFSGVLGQFQKKGQEEGMIQTRSRSEGKEADGVQDHDRVSDLDTHSEEVHEKQETGKTEETQQEAQTEQALQTAIESATDSPKKDQQQQQDNEGSQQQNQAITEAQGPQGAAGAHPIPPEILEKLVAQIFVGVNAEGAQMFNFTFQEGVLSGCAVSVTSNGAGRIKLSISGLEGQAKRLLSASEGDIAKRLASHKLDLESFEVL